MFKRFFYTDGLTNLLGSDGNYLINILGQVKDKFGNDVRQEIDNNGYRVVTVHGWNGLTTYRVIDLVALQFKNLQIPKKYCQRVSAFVLDGDKLNEHAENIGYRFKDGPLPVDDFDGFFYIPGYPNNAINKDGVLLNVKTKNKIKNWYITKPGVKNAKNGYRITTCMFSTKRPVGISRHRVLGLTFLPYPDNVDKMTINHKDGIPGNDDLSNLEWVTRGENNLHAYVNDLKSQHKRVLVRNVLTDEVTEYYSISECSRALGYASDETIRQRLLTSNFCQVFQEGNQLKFKDDKRDWIIPDDPEKEVIEARQKRKIKVKNYITNEIILYDSLTEASKITNIQIGTIEFRLKNTVKTLIEGFYFKDISDKTPWPEFNKEALEKSFKDRIVKIVARNLLSNQVKEFASLRQAEALTDKPLYFQIVRDKQPLFKDGWQFKKANQEWLEIENFEETLYKLNRDITAREESTGKIYIAESALQMGNLLKLDSKSIRLAAYTRGNELYKGYRFRLGVTTDPWPTTSLSVEKV